MFFQYSPLDLVDRFCYNGPNAMTAIATDFQECSVQSPDTKRSLVRFLWQTGGSRVALWFLPRGDSENFGFFEVKTVDGMVHRIWSISESSDYSRNPGCVPSGALVLPIEDARKVWEVLHHHGWKIESSIDSGSGRKYAP